MKGKQSVLAVFTRGRGRLFAVTHTRTIVSYNNNRNNKCYLQIIITCNNGSNNNLSIYTSVKWEKYAIEEK